MCVEYLEVGSMIPCGGVLVSCYMVFYMFHPHVLICSVTLLISRL